MSMQRWDPVTEMRRLQNRMSRLWGRQPFSMFEFDEAEAWSVPLDVREQDGQVIVEASVPGADPENLDVSIEDGVLTIKGETKSEREEKTEEGYLLKERHEGSFYRAVRLPESVDPEHAQSNYDNGVLRITLPKMPEKQPRKIKVETGGGSQAIGSAGERETPQSGASAEEMEM